jgi:hypothetical protein
MGPQVQPKFRLATGTLAPLGHGLPSNGLDRLPGQIEVRAQARQFRDVGQASVLAGLLGHDMELELARG